MKLLHTSDWHLGKRLLGKDLVPIQQDIVREIAETAESKRADVVVVVGDVFDGASPDAAAVNVFLEGVERITAGGKRAMVVVPGRCDSPALMDSFRHLSRGMNLFVLADSGTVCDIDTEADHDVRPVETGRGYVVFENRDGERMAVAGVSERSIVPKGDETYAAAAERVIDSVCRRFSPETVNVLAGYLRVATENPLDDTEGGDYPDCSVFPEHMDYAALGGIHKSEVASIERNVYYSGAIMPYSFDDNKGEKGVITATVSKEGVRKEVTKLKASKKLKKVRCASLTDAQAQLDRYYDCLVELALSLPQPLQPAESKLLREKYDNLLCIDLAVAGLKGEGKKPALCETLPPKELFKAFCKSRTDAQVSEELAALYLALTEDEEK